jgi:methylenetetrahydrofolate dehydrogenase (NADP+)/methenyltetrahydrofolate cyclohydrolase
MTARILDGRSVASHLWRELSGRVTLFVERHEVAPRLAILRFDDDGPSSLYATSVERGARGIGIEPLVVTAADGVAAVDLVARIGALNRDPSVAGIVIAQPLPAGLSLQEITAEIEPAKDVDGATAENAGRLARGESALVPATALAVMELLRRYEVPIEGRRAVVIGRSAVVGRPVAQLLLAADATVTVCHRRTQNLARETRRADILIAAAGVAHLVGREMVTRGCTIVDAGINVTAQGVVGDVDFAAVRHAAAGISPVPGGVGPVTTMMLLSQTMDAAERLAQAAAQDESLARFEAPAAVGSVG